MKNWHTRMLEPEGFGQMGFAMMCVLKLVLLYRYVCVSVCLCLCVHSVWEVLWLLSPAQPGKAALRKHEINESRKKEGILWCHAPSGKNAMGKHVYIKKTPSSTISFPQWHNIQDRFWPGGRNDRDHDKSNPHLKACSIGEHLSPY